jgi:hypothetical protein
MKAKASLLGILAATAILNQPIASYPEIERKPLLGNQGWGRAHNPKQKRSRAKEKRAKLARKINWS